MNKNFFVKSHGLGNEYAVLDEELINFKLTTQAIKRLCNINYGLGTDGLLLKVASQIADVGLKIFNPDGSEAEKSGNGVRIFSKYVFDYKIVNKDSFSIETKGGVVHAKVLKVTNGKANLLEINMGKAIFKSNLIPTLIESEEVKDYKISLADKEFEINCVSMGNPHCVILVDELSIDEIKKYGPQIETHKLFPNRINVQFVKPVNRKSAEILIWERGAGFTKASGSSSSAVACVLKRKGLIDSDVTIKMIGGELKISVDDNYNVNMTGEVRQICSGLLADELVEDLETPFV